MSRESDDSREIIAKLKLLRPVLHDKMGIRRLRVFGSVARGDAGPDSDVDLIADFDTLPGWSFFTMDEKISNLLGGIKVDLTTERGLHKRLKERILTEARDVW